MYLRTPKRYTAKGRRRRLINLRWLWLYLLAPVIIIPAALAWQNRASISQSIADWTASHIRFDVNPPTPTPTVPAADLRAHYISFVQDGNMKNAIAALSSLADASPNDVSLHATLARMILFRDDPDDATRQAAALRAAYGAVNADPEATEGWIAMGMALNGADRPQEALAYLLHARDFDNRNPLMLAAMAETYNNLDRADRATNLINEAIDNANAANPVDAVTLAYAYWVKGDILSRAQGTEALAAWEEAWRIAQTDQTMPVGYIAQSLWVYYFNTADTTKIVGIMNDAAKRDKDDPINPYLLGRVYLKAGDQPKARASLEHCLDLNPNQIKCLRWLGTVMYRDNNYQRAGELGQRAVDLGSKDPGAYLIAGLSYALTNRCAEAAPLLQAGLQLNPDANLLQQFQDGLRTCGTGGVAIPPPTATAPPGG